MFLEIELADEYETGKAARLQRYEASCSHSAIAFFIVETKTMQPCKVLAPYDILDRRIVIPEFCKSPSVNAAVVIPSTYAGPTSCHRTGSAPFDDDLSRKGTSKLRRAKTVSQTSVAVGPFPT